MKRHLCRALLLLAFVAPVHAQPLTPSGVARDIQLHGAHATVQSLSRAGRFDAVMNRIASGNAAWVRLSPELARGTDAGNSTSLSVALARALPRNPQAVLTVLDDGPVTGSAVVCSVPFVEPSPQDVKEYLRRALPAVKRVPESERLPQRTPCLRMLEHMAEETETHSS